MSCALANWLLVFKIIVGLKTSFHILVRNYNNYNKSFNATDCFYNGYGIDMTFSFFWGQARVWPGFDDCTTIGLMMESFAISLQYLQAQI